MRLTQEVEPIHRKSLQSRRPMAPRGGQKPVVHGATQVSDLVGLRFEPWGVGEAPDPLEVERATWSAQEIIVDNGRDREARRGSSLPDAAETLEGAA